MQKLILILFIATGFWGFSQESENSKVLKEFKATVINAQTSAPMESVHIVNLNKVVGTITNEKGEFAITAAINDTLYFSFLGFKSQKIRVTNDMFKFEDTKISLTELAYALEEVIVRPLSTYGFFRDRCKEPAHQQCLSI